MGIFAGAPRTTTPEPWVVLPRGPRRVQSTLRSATSPSAMRTSTSNRLSRNVDAVIDAGTFPRTDDSEEPDFLGPLLDHSLRRRGLSDSSIHSTFAAEEKRTPAAPDDYPQESGWPTETLCFNHLVGRCRILGWLQHLLLLRQVFPRCRLQRATASSEIPTPKGRHPLPRALGS